MSILVCYSFGDDGDEQFSFLTDDDYLPFDYNSVVKGYKSHLIRYSKSSELIQTLCAASHFFDRLELENRKFITYLANITDKQYEIIEWRGIRYNLIIFDKDNIAIDILVEFI